MNQLTEQSVGCPYCGETIDVLIDSSDAEQQYIEDCQVCCKPINFLVSESINGDVTVNVFSEMKGFNRYARLNDAVITKIICLLFDNKFKKPDSFI